MPMMLRAALMLVLVGTVQDAAELARNAMEKFLKRDFAGAIEDLNRAVELDPQERRQRGARLSQEEGLCSGAAGLFQSHRARSEMAVGLLRAGQDPMPERGLRRRHEGCRPGLQASRGRGSGPPLPAGLLPHGAEQRKKGE